MQYNKLVAVTAIFVSFTLGHSVAEAQTAAKPATQAAVQAAGKLSSDSTVGDLLEYAPAKAVLLKHIPEMVSNPQIDMAAGMTLRSLQAYSSDLLTDAKLAEIDTELAKLPPQANSKK